MSMVEEIAKQSGLLRVLGYTVVNYGGEAVYVEGVNKLIFVSGESVKISVGKKQIEVTGEGLVIDSMETGALVIKGRVAAIAECGNV